MSTCLKAFRLEVINASDILAWWTLEEAADPRIDSAHGTELNRTFGFNDTTSAGPGKVNLGFRMQASTPTFETLMSSGLFVPSSSPDLGDGLSFAFWAKFDAWHEATALFVDGYVTFPAQNFFLSFEWLSFNGPDGNISLTCENGVDSFQLEVPFAPVAGTWHFFHVFWLAGQFGVSVDNGVEQLSPDSVAISGGIADSMAMDLGMLSGSAAAGNTDLTFDEVGFFPRKLTAAQVAYLYNAGTGRTWPVALP